MALVLQYYDYIFDYRNLAWCKLDIYGVGNVAWILYDIFLVVKKYKRKDFNFSLTKQVSCFSQVHQDINYIRFIFFFVNGVCFLKFFGI